MTPPPANKKSMLVAGIMSGTSADGIDVALCRISAARPRPRIELVRHRAFPYPATLRKAVLAAMDAREYIGRRACPSQLAPRRGLWRRRAGQPRRGMRSTSSAVTVRPSITRASPKPYAGRSIACTWQLGEARPDRRRRSCARRLELSSCRHGRPADRERRSSPCSTPHSSRIRAARACCRTSAASPTSPSSQQAEHSISLIAFDTGPANMVIDALTQQLFGKPYDRGGRLAAAGTPNEAVLSTLLRDPYYRQRPPKSAGREQYGDILRRSPAIAREASSPYIARHSRHCDRAHLAQHRARLAPLPGSASRRRIRRLHRRRRWRAQPDADAHARR